MSILTLESGAKLGPPPKPVLGRGAWAAIVIAVAAVVIPALAHFVFKVW